MEQKANEVCLLLEANFSVLTSLTFSRCKVHKIADLHFKGENKVYVYNITTDMSEQTDYPSGALTFNKEEGTKLRVDEISHGSLFEIATSALLESQCLSTRSKIFLSIRWNNHMALRRIMDQMPLDSRKLSEPVKLVYNGPALAHAAMCDNSGVMEVLYDNGIKSVNQTSFARRRVAFFTAT